MLYFNITEICKVRQIERPYTFLVNAGISPRTASNIVNNYSRAVRLDHIEKICEALHCQPNDILLYEPNNPKAIPENHPLTKLMVKPNDISLQQMLKTVPINQLREMAESINKPKENKVE